MSLIAELKESKSPLKLNGNSISFRNLLFAIDPSLVCKIVDGVLYISDAEVIRYQSNALNYVFPAFEVPTDAEKFRITFRYRLKNGPWEDMKKQKLIQPGLGGFVSADGNRSPLKEEMLRNISARDLLFRVASQQRLVSVLQFPLPSQKPGPKDEWALAAKNWTWEIQH